MDLAPSTHECTVVDTVVVWVDACEVYAEYNWGV